MMSDKQPTHDDSCMRSASFFSGFFACCNPQEGQSRGKQAHRRDGGQGGPRRVPRAAQQDFQTDR